MKRRRLCGLALLLLISGGVHPCLPQGNSQEPEPESAHLETIEVEVVNVDVRVTDRKGRPVTNLEAGDFEVLVDGEPVEISNFSLVERVDPGTLDKAASETRSEIEETVGSVSVPPPVVEHPVWLAIYIDQLQIRQGDRHRLMRRLSDFVEATVGPDTQILIASHDGALTVRQGFTTDRQAIDVALQAIDASPTRGARFQAKRWELLRSIDTANHSVYAVNAIKPYVDSVGHDLELSLGGLERMLDQLVGLPGRREILFVSSGLPRVLGGELFLAIEHKFADGQGLYQLWNHDWTSRFQAVGSAANARGVTLNMLDASGVRPTRAADSESEGLSTPKIQGMLDFDLNNNVQEPLQMLAEETGGLAILNRNNPSPALERMTTGFDTYYSLGFLAQNVGDDAYHGIEVRVRREKLSVRHREGYVDRSLESRVHSRLRASLIHAIEENPLSVDLILGDLSVSGSGRTVVPLQISIPIDRLTLVSSDSGRIGSVRVFLAIMDDKGRMSDVVEKPLRIELPTAADSGDEDHQWRYTHKMIIGEGRYRLAVGVLDFASGLASYLSRAVNSVAPRS